MLALDSREENVWALFRPGGIPGRHTHTHTHSSGTMALMGIMAVMNLAD